MKILAVDDHPIFLNSLTNLLSYQIPKAEIFRACDGIPAIKILTKEKPDIILLDINMPVMNGLEVAEYVNKNHPEIKIIILTNVDGQAMVLNLVKIVHGFLLKNIDGEELGNCIDAVMKGKKYFCTQTREIIFKNMSEMDKLPVVHFTQREALLVELMAGGKTSKEMSTILMIKEKTINRFREELLKKTKTKNTSELVAFAFHNGLI